MRNYVVTFAKSLVVGSTMLVPGVSGGSMSMILGIYTKLISSVSSFMKNKFRNSLFLTIFLAGSLIGIVSFSNPILHLIESHKRRIKNGIDIDITAYLRGQQTVEIDGTIFTINPPQVLKDRVSENSKRLF